MGRCNWALLHHMWVSVGQALGDLLLGALLSTASYHSAEV